MSHPTNPDVARLDRQVRQLRARLDAIEKLAALATLGELPPRRRPELRLIIGGAR